MNKPWDIIKELESDNSRLKKEAIIKREHEADNVRFFTGVGACLDSFEHLEFKRFRWQSKMLP